jgi:dTDP-4-dehydrorhamnose reductase
MVEKSSKVHLMIFMEKVLIIGGSGLLGSKICEIFPDAFATYNITQISRKNTFKLDISDRDSLRFALDKLEPDTVIVTAALTDVDRCEIHPEMAVAVNTEPFNYITSYLKRKGGRLIQISTDYVFSGEKGNYSEKDERKPINVYGKTKMDAENIIINSGIDFSLVRTSGIFGINESTGKNNFFTWIYNNLRTGNEIRLVTDQIYSPVLNTVLAKVIYEIYEREINGIIHFSSLDSISRFEFGTLIAEIFNLRKERIYHARMEDMAWIAKRPKNSSLNNDKALNILSVKPITVSEELNMVKGLISSDE